jgi:hypothetical protein
MIEYLPFIALGFAFFAQKYLKKIVLALIIIPFCGLAMVQSYQVANSILNGGLTTKKEYWSHFLQLKTDAPNAKKPTNLRVLSHKKLSKTSELDDKQAFSTSLETVPVSKAKQAFVEITIGAEHKNTDIRLVLSSKDGSFYKDQYLGDFLYETPRTMRFLFDLPSSDSCVYQVYVWNGDTKTKALIQRMELTLFGK